MFIEALIASAAVSFIPQASFAVRDNDDISGRKPRGGNVSGYTDCFD